MDVKRNMANIDENLIPSIIKSQFADLRRLENKVDESMKKARLAKTSAETAKKSAEIARNKSAGLFHKKEAIESLQGASVNLAESTVSVAEAQISSSEAQKVSFDYQKKLGECTKYLFGLGVSSIAANRTVIRELEKRLSGASEEELGELAQQEIIGVLQQLKAQEDILIQQKKMQEHLRGLRDQVLMQQQTNDEQNSLLNEHLRRIKNEELRGADRDRRLNAWEIKASDHDNVLQKQIEKDKEHDRRLDEGDQKDLLHDRLLNEQTQKDKEHDRRLDAGDEKDARQDKLIEALHERSMQHEHRIELSDEKNADLDRLLILQVKKSEEHSQRLSALDEKEDAQEKNIEELFKRSADNCSMLNQHKDKLLFLEDSNAKQNEELLHIQNQLDVHEKKNMDQDSVIEKIKEEIGSLDQKKTNIPLTVGAYIVGIIGLILAIIHFI